MLSIALNHIAGVGITRYTNGPGREAGPEAGIELKGAPRREILSNVDYCEIVLKNRRRLICGIDVDWVSGIGLIALTQNPNSDVPGYTVTDVWATLLGIPHDVRGGKDRYAGR